jgi:hypothetical protein
MLQLAPALASCCVFRGAVFFGEVPSLALESGILPE